MRHISSMLHAHTRVSHTKTHTFEAIVEFQLLHTIRVKVDYFWMHLKKSFCSFFFLMRLFQFGWAAYGSVSSPCCRCRCWPRLHRQFQCVCVCVCACVCLCEQGEEAASQGHFQISLVGLSCGREASWLTRRLFFLDMSSYKGHLSPLKILTPQNVIY